MNNILILICLEAKEPKTEKEFFKSITDKNKEYIRIQYLDPEKIDSESLSDINCKKLNELIKNKEDKIEYEIICFCDGDIANEQMQSIKNTKSLVCNYLESKFKIVLTSKLLYDLNHSFEFFIWLITEKFDENFYYDSKDDINKLRNKYVNDIVEIYRKYNSQITDINKFKKNSNIIWKPIVDFHVKDEKDHLEICKIILSKFDKNRRFSIYFEILEKIIEKYEILYRQYFLKNE